MVYGEQVCEVAIDGGEVRGLRDQIGDAGHAAVLLATGVVSPEEVAAELQMLAGYVPARPDGRGKLPPIGGKPNW